LVATFDCHANLSQAMVDHADMLIGYDTYPHIDMAARGREVADALAAMLQQAARPACAFRKLPLLTAPQMQATELAPMKKIMAALHRFETDGAILNGSIAVGFPYADIADLGASILTYAEDQSAADRVADQLAEMIWEARDQFQPDLMPVDEAVTRAMAADETPVVMASALVQRRFDRKPDRLHHDIKAHRSDITALMQLQLRPVLGRPDQIGDLFRQIGDMDEPAGRGRGLGGAGSKGVIHQCIAEKGARGAGELTRNAGAEDPMLNGVERKRAEISGVTFRLDGVLDDRPDIVGDLEIGDVHRDPLQPDHRRARPETEADHGAWRRLRDRVPDRRPELRIVDRQDPPPDPLAADHLPVQALHDLLSRIDRACAVALKPCEQHVGSPKDPSASHETGVSENPSATGASIQTKRSALVGRIDANPRT
jgi:hypothetical protein